MRNICLSFFFFFCTFSLLFAQPIVNLGNDTTVCNGSSVLFNAGNNGASFIWSTGETTQTISVNNSGTYWVDVTNVGGTSRDSIVLSVIDSAIFIVRDTVICGGLVSLSINGDPNGTYFWWDAPSSGNLLGTGQQLNKTFFSDTTLYIESRVVSAQLSAGRTAPGGTASGNYYSVSTISGQNPLRGLVFDVTETILLEQLTIFSNGIVNGTLQLVNSSGTTLYSLPLALNHNGGLNLSLNWVIPTGNNYQILLLLQSGSGSLFVDIPITYPINSNGFNIRQGTPFPTHYNYFYDIKFRKFNCPSFRKSMFVDVLPTPIINFPVDTIVCYNELNLDVSYANAVYLWSNGNTSSNIQFYPNSIKDTISVTITIGICASSDTLIYTVFDSITFQSFDTTICGGLFESNINAQGIAHTYWWDSLNGGNLIATDLLSQILYDSTVYYVETRPISNKNNEGFANNYVLNQSFSNFYLLSGTGDYGNFFDVRNEVHLDSVTIFVDIAPVSGTIKIYNSVGTVIFSKNVLLLPGTNQIHIGCYLPIGNNYKIIISDIIGAGKIFIDSPTLFPINGTNLTIKNGIPQLNTYFFYNWCLSKTVCPAPRKPITVNVLPTKNINWPTDTIICAGSINLDVSYPNSTYLWNDGQTSSSITVSALDTVWAQVTTGSCVSKDTVFVFLSTPPTQIIVPADTVVCGGLLTLQAGGDAQTYAWYNLATGGTAFEFGQEITVNVTDTITYYVEGLNLLRNTNTYGHQVVPIVSGTYTSIQGSNYIERGLLFDVFKTLRIDEVSVFTDGPVNARITLKDDLGYEIQTQNIQLNSSGEHVIILNWLLEPANNYSIWMDSIQGSGRIYVVSNYAFPLSYTELRIKGGLPSILNNQYNSFYKWRISTPSCPTTRQAVQVFVPEYPSISMSADTVICNGNSVSIQSTAPNAGYQYIWNTGATSMDITALSAGYYSVTVTNAEICSLEKNIFVQFPVTPISPVISDTTICNPQILDLLENPNNAIYVWYNNFLNPIYISAPYSYDIQDTTIFNVTLAARSTTRIGEQSHPNPNDLNQYESFILSNTFNVLKPTVLDSVAVYFKNAPVNFDIVLSDSLNNELVRRSFLATQSQEKLFVPLGFVIMPGNNYQLKFDNIDNNRFLVNRFVSYPQSSYAGIAELTGTSFSGVSYNCFYDWHFSYALDGCYAAQNDQFSVNVTLPVNLSDSIFTCTDILLDATVSAANSYSWSNGAATASILADTTGLYTVTVSDGAGCSYSSSTFVQTPLPVIFNTFNNSLCGSELSTSYNSVTANNFIWSSGDSTTQINVSTTGSYSLTITTTEGCNLSGTTQINNIEIPPAVDLGNILDICTGTTLDAGFGGQGMSYLWNTGESTQSITVSFTDTYSVTVTSPNQCAGSDFVYVREIADPVANFIYSIFNNSVSFNNVSDNETSVLWTFGDGGSTVQQNPFHLYPNSDCYNVMLVAFNACGSDTIEQTLAIGVDSSACNVVYTALIPNTDEMIVSPNPNDGNFIIQFSSPVAFISSIELYSIQGQLISQSELQLKNKDFIAYKIENIAPGIYIIVCQSDRGKLIQRLIIK